jgi:hypothetical protein
VHILPLHLLCIFVLFFLLLRLHFPHFYVLIFYTPLFPFFGVICLRSFSVSCFLLFLSETSVAPSSVFLLFSCDQVF